MLKKILAPVDGSLKSMRALRYAADMAENLSADLEVLNVQRLKDVTIVEPISWEAPVLKERAEKVFSMAREALEGKNINVTYKMLQGDPADEICRYADYDKFDLIIIGAHGLSGVKRFMLGSVATKVSYHSMVPVLIVK